MNLIKNNRGVNPLFFINFLKCFDGGLYVNTFGEKYVWTKWDKICVDKMG